MKKITLSFEDSVDADEVKQALAYLVENWPWPASASDIVRRLVRDEEKKFKAIHKAVRDRAVLGAFKEKKK